MEQTKPLFIIKKYRSILFAAIIVEAVGYIVSLTDTIVAGNMINGTALAAIGLISPFVSFSIFISSIINSGTILNYSYNIGSFNKQRAMEFFAQGVYMALLAGIVSSGLMFVLRDFFLAIITPSAEMRQYAGEYYNIILLVILLNPLSFLLDNMTVTDGGEKVSTVANVTGIISNIVLSFQFAGIWGVSGIAAASVISKVLVISINLSRLLSKNNSLKLIRYWNTADAVKIIKSGIVKASNYALEAINVFIINLFATHYFDSDTLILLVMIEKFLGLMTLFVGLSMAAQPLIGTLNGEKNYKALRYLMRSVSGDMVIVGLFFTVFTILNARYLVYAFGIRDENLLRDGVLALQTVSWTLVIHAILVLYFLFYYLTDRQLLSFMVCVIKNLLSPLTLAVLFSLITKDHTGLWIGLAAAPLLSLIVCSQAIYVKLGKQDQGEFPLLLSGHPDEDTYIYDIEITKSNIATLKDTVLSILEPYPFPGRTKNLVALFTEELFMLIHDKNKGQTLIAECTIIVEESGIRLITRDDGIHIDLTDKDAVSDSFRQYVVSSILNLSKSNAYVLTTGYNRNELFIT